MNEPRRKLGIDKHTALGRKPARVTRPAMRRNLDIGARPAMHRKLGKCRTLSIGAANSPIQHSRQSAAIFTNVATFALAPQTRQYCTLSNASQAWQYAAIFTKAATFALAPRGLLHLPNGIKKAD